MKNHKKLTRLFVKTTARLIFIVLIITVLNTVLQSPVLTNEMAIQQMETNNDGFIIWELFNTLRPAVGVVIGFLGLWMCYGVYKDVYKFIKNDFEDAFNN